MVGSVKQVAIRLKPEGGAEVVAEAKRVEDALVGGATRTKTATEAAVTAADRQVQKLREVAAEASKAPRSPVQANIDRITGVSTGGNARADVAARTLYAADERAARTAAAIRAEIDPLWAATDRYNRELAEMNALQARGHLTAMEFARGQELAKGRLDATTAALARNTGGLTRNQMASRLNLSRQGADVLVTAAMGMNPAMIAIQQGPQIMDALATSGIKARASMLLLGGAVTAVAAGVAVAGYAVWDAGQQNLALERAVTGLGRASGLTAEQLDELARAGAAQGEVSIKSAREQGAAYLATGRIAGEIIPGLIALGKDYASVFGIDAEQATQNLAKAMVEPDKAARELTRTMGIFDQATLDNIDSLMKQGDQLAAQKILLEGMEGALKDHADNVDGMTDAWQALGRWISDTTTKFGEWLYVTDAERLAQLDRDIARVERGGARSGAFDRNLDRTLEGDGGLARMRAERDALAAEIGGRQRSPDEVAQAAANQAAQLEKDREARNRPDRSGARAAEREAREAEQRRRREEDRQLELQIAEARAYEDADRIRALEDQEAVTRRIRELEDAEVPAAEARAQAEAEQARLVAAREVSTERQLDVLLRTQGIEYERLLGNEAFARGLERQEELTARIQTYEKAGVKTAVARALAQRDLLELEEARVIVMGREVALAAEAHALTLARLSGDERRTRQLETQERIQQRAREIERREVLNYGDGEARARSEIEEEIAAEAVGAGRDWVKGFVDDIRRGDIGDAVAEQLESAADRMVDRLIDSLFDMDWSAIFQGQGAQSGGISGVLSAVGAFFTGGIGRNAAGTDHWRGGLTWVGEEGPELAWLPTGSKVASHPRSMAMMAQAAGAGPARIVDARTYNFTGNLMTPEFYAEIDRRDRMASQVGATRGASAAVSIVDATAAEKQRGDRMMRG
jgi:hypothetical protein